ncbi:hypothetical protein M752DRAFT_23629 [Aspergillus phoenicis ATCC 13157]|uniref:Uncharacterized protein n=1 Tax=Aspergillus phoenicis ATCC 13157 TaxID=1353007 RepID=A0A370PIN1_ASPPH|nr:hypothetical protein M752DRAFT_23629 [Aspergillus phoenicis ATCC 13157]
MHIGYWHFPLIYLPSFSSLPIPNYLPHYYMAGFPSLALISRPPLMLYLIPIAIIFIPFSPLLFRDPYLLLLPIALFVCFLLLSPSISHCDSDHTNQTTVSEGILL